MASIQSKHLILREADLPGGDNRLFKGIGMIKQHTYTSIPCVAFTACTAKLNRSRIQSGRGHSLRRKIRTLKSVGTISSAYTAVDAAAVATGYRYVGSCSIFLPNRNKKPRAIIQFMGGAFIGAIPHVSYSFFLQLIADEGFLVISVPYNVTFDHAEAAKEVYERFNACLDTILASGLPNCNLTADDLAHLPIYSVAHSNGALLQVLTGSYFSEKLPKANVVISFNNRPATEAVPYFEQFGPMVSQLMPIVQASPVYPIFKNAPDASKVLLDMANTLGPNNDQESIATVMKFVDQLPSVFNQISQGISEFRPPPHENRDLVRQLYNVSRTLLVKFNFDNIDDTDLLEESLKSRVDSIGGRLEKRTLNGTHLTPCTQGPVWQVGKVYTPVDSILQGLRRMTLNDTKTLSTVICQWLEEDSS